MDIRKMMELWVAAEVVAPQVQAARDQVLDRIVNDTKSATESWLRQLKTIPEPEQEIVWLVAEFDDRRMQMSDTDLMCVINIAGQLAERTQGG